MICPFDFFSIFFILFRIFLDWLDFLILVCVCCFHWRALPSFFCVLPFTIPFRGEVAQSFYRLTHQAYTFYTCILFLFSFTLSILMAWRDGKCHDDDDCTALSLFHFALSSSCHVTKGFFLRHSLFWLEVGFSLPLSASSLKGAKRNCIRF